MSKNETGMSKTNRNLINENIDSMKENAKRPLHKCLYALANQKEMLYFHNYERIDPFYDIGTVL